VHWTSSGVASPTTGPSGRPSSDVANLSRSPLRHGHGVRSHALPVALLGECSIPVV
jgi:hypothetical protein